MVCVYEDEGIGRLSPLVDLRPAFDLRCGRRTLLEKLRLLYPQEEFHLWVRDGIAELVAEAHVDCRVNKPVRQGRLFISARAILGERISPRGQEAVLLAGDDVVGFRLCAECAVKMSSLGGLTATLAQEQVKAKVVKWPWNLADFNVIELERECRRHGRASAGRSRTSKAGTLPRGTVLVGPSARLTIAAGARLWPGAVVSTETGPVMIGRGAAVRPGSLVEGPCYIGPGTIIDGARVGPGCSFGPECRIGGEVEASVFQGFSNKHHEGFLGHSFVGEWVNLGAMTVNSDLKNAYQSVRVSYGGRQVDTGLLKVGCYIGDHVKTAIGSLLNTGVRVGTFANWFESGLSPKEIPAFAWGAGARWELADALVCARQVMLRRGIEMTSAYEKRLASLWGSRGDSVSSCVAGRKA